MDKTSILIGTGKELNKRYLPPQTHTCQPVLGSLCLL